MSRSKWKKKSLYIASFIEDSLDDYGNKITIYTEPVFVPEGEEVYGDNANYKVDSVRNQNRKIAIYFEKLPNK